MDVKISRQPRIQLDAGTPESVAFTSLNRKSLEKNCVSNVEHVETCRNCCLLGFKSQYSAVLLRWNCFSTAITELFSVSRGFYLVLVIPAEMNDVPSLLTLSLEIRLDQVFSLCHNKKKDTKSYTVKFLRILIYSLHHQ